MLWIPLPFSSGNLKTRHGTSAEVLADPEGVLVSRLAWEPRWRRVLDRCADHAAPARALTFSIIRCKRSQILRIREALPRPSSASASLLSVASSGLKLARKDGQIMSPDANLLWQSDSLFSGYGNAGSLGKLGAPILGTWGVL